MRESDAALVGKARESIRIARVILAEGAPGFAASRAYYAMFYLAEAILASRDQAYSSHSAVHAAFGRDFVAAGLVPRRFHQYLTAAQDLRLLGDYRWEREVSAVQAGELITQAEEFLLFAGKFLADSPAE